MSWHTSPFSIPPARNYEHPVSQPDRPPGVRTLRRDARRAASQGTVTRTWNGVTTYHLDIRPGVKVHASVCTSGEKVASFTRETGSRKTDILGTLNGRSAAKVVRALRNGYYRKAPATASPGRGVIAGPG